MSREEVRLWRRHRYEQQFETAKAQLEQDLWPKWAREAPADAVAAAAAGPEESAAAVERREADAAAPAAADTSSSSSGPAAAHAADDADAEDNDVWQFEDDDELVDHSHVRSPESLEVTDNPAAAAAADTVRQALLDSGLYSEEELDKKMKEEAAATSAGEPSRGDVWFSYRLLPSEWEEVAGRDQPDSFAEQELVFRTRRVAVHVRLDALRLPAAVRARLEAIAGPGRYDAPRGVLKLVSDSEPDQAGNRRRVELLLRALVAAAYEADANYIPPPPPPPPPSSSSSSSSLADPEAAERLRKQLADAAAVRDGICRLLVQDGVEPGEARRRADEMDLGPGFQVAAAGDADDADADADADDVDAAALRLPFEPEEFILMKISP